MTVDIEKRLAALDHLGRQTTVRIDVAKKKHKDVEYSRDIERVMNLRMRPHAMFSGASRDRLRQVLTRPGSGMRLWDVQCAALLAALDAQTRVHPERRAPGLYGAVTVGQGKTLIAALLGTVWRVARVVVLTKASLAPQTQELIDEYRADFFVPDDVRVLSYTTLSNRDNKDVLEALAPDAVVADEAHALRNPSSARGKRIRRYIDGRPNTLLAVLTGTTARDSLMDWAELADLALGDWSPAPREYPVRRAWAQALDDEPTRGLGSLRLLVKDAGPETTAADVRSALADRVARAAGCVASLESGPEDVLVRVRVLQDPTSEKIQLALLNLVKTWTRPDGEELSLAPEFAEVDRQLRLGGYYGWKYEPDREWLRVRRAFKKAVREWIKHHPSWELDSMFAVEGALMRKAFSLAEYDAWVDIRDRSKEPPKVWRWVDDVVAKWWADKIRLDAAFHGSHAAAFGARVAFAQKVAELAEAPYYGGGTKVADELRQELKKTPGDRSIVCSFQAHKEGKNFQHSYHRAYFLDPPPSGSDWEQALGRLHRHGQQSPEVIFEISRSFIEELGRAQNNAEWLAQTEGRPYRLQRAQIELVKG